MIQGLGAKTVKKLVRPVEVEVFCHKIFIKP